jgi:uncharacterized RmlC-like cupin family protein
MLESRMSRQVEPATRDSADASDLTPSRRESMSPAEVEPMAPGARDEIVTIRPDAAVRTRQRLPYFVGVSQSTAGACGISMNLVVIPPGGAAEPHLHRGFETAIYVLEGEVETRYGPGLARSVVNRPGDFLFIPADLPHQPINRSGTAPARAIVARNDADEQESVVPYDAAADR